MLLPCNDVRVAPQYSFEDSINNISSARMEIDNVQSWCDQSTFVKKRKTNLNFIKFKLNQKEKNCVFFFFNNTYKCARIDERAIRVQYISLRYGKKNNSGRL